LPITTEIHIKFLGNLSEKIAKKMEKDMIAYETKHGVVCHYTPFSMVLENNIGETIGALTGYTAFAEIYIDDLWVDANYRHQGYGHQLLKELENHFRGKGFNNMNLVTNQFQAPEFYLKCGFEIEFIRPNKLHPELTKTFFIKNFDAKELSKNNFPKFSIDV